jgi:hypothetical protein
MNEFLLMCGLEQQDAYSRLVAEIEKLRAKGFGCMTKKIVA